MLGTFMLIQVPAVLIEYHQPAGMNEKRINLIIAGRLA